MEAYQERVYRLLCRQFRHISILNGRTVRYFLSGSCGFGYDNESSDLDVVVDYRSIYLPGKGSVDELITKAYYWTDIQNIWLEDIHVDVLSTTVYDSYIRMEIALTDDDHPDECPFMIDLTFTFMYDQELLKHENRMEFLLRNPSIVKFMKTGKEMYGKLIHGSKVIGILDAMIDQ